MLEAPNADRQTVEDNCSTALAVGEARADAVLVKGRVRIECFGPDGTLKAHSESDNIVTTVGRAMIADRLLASTAGGATVPTHMGVGTSGTAPAVGDASITGETRVALTSKTRAANVVTFVGDWAAGQATATLQEAGLWDASSGGNLTGRVTFTSIAKGANDTLKVTWTWTIG